MDKLVYGLCTITSALTAGLLVRGYLRARMRLLLWSALCFIFIAASNVLVYVDFVMFAGVEMPELTITRAILNLTGLGLLIYGMVWETV